MSVFMERLRAALGTDYEVLNELASGGMGVVYRARDRALDRLVAIKIIRPDLATASMRERFLREARVLASFSHPNIVPVHRAGEADGLAYYVMDFLQGETLADRLRRGPLTADEFRLVANDLLAALEVVHEHGVVHRDVKPSNVFMTTGRAVLSDFGISKPSGGEATGLTASGHIVGTPGYMPPEQLAGSDVTVRTDIAAAAMVLFEACTGTPWSFDSHSEDADWSRVPADAAPAIRRALAWSPSERLASVREFRASLAGRAPPGRRRAARAVAVLAGLIAIVAWAIWPKVPAPLVVNVHRLTDDIGDSVAARLVDELRAAADVEFRLDTGARSSSADIDVRGRVTRLGESLRVHILATGRAVATPFNLDASGSRSDVVDSMAPALLQHVWESQDTSYLGLPIEALPRTVTGRIAWARGEALYARANWTRAAQAYRDAVATDSTCALCELRQMTISRWLRSTGDPALTHRVVAASERFPPAYQRMIRAGIDTTNRWAALRDMAAASPRLYLAQLVYGDELFHRGALAGRSRSEAINYFRRAILLRHTFAPSWQHLEWVAIAEGNQPLADSAKGAYDRYGAKDDPETMLVQYLLLVGYYWRFMPAEEAAALTQRVLSDPQIAGVSDLSLAARYLGVFDAPGGVTWFGETFARWNDKPELRTPGLVAQVVGLLAQGRTDSARAIVGLLRGEGRDPESRLSAAEFETALVLFDSLDARASRPRLDSLLASLTDGRTANTMQRRRAAWMRILLARRATAHVPPGWRALVAGEQGLKPFSTLLDADSVAGRRDWRRAIGMTDTLLSLDSAGIAGDPFFRSALHLMRAQWQANAGDRDAAINSLLWHENYDVVEATSAVTQAADADVAFGTVGRWYRARLLDLSGARGTDVCAAFDGAARLWAGGDPRYRARAVEARAALARLGCPAR